MRRLTIRTAVPEDAELILGFVTDLAIYEKAEDQVLDWNEPSIRFYEALGAKAQGEWVRYRLTGEALLNLAREGGQD